MGRHAPTHSDEKRQAVLYDVVVNRMPINGAARKHQVPASTISSWMLGADDERAERQSGAVETCRQVQGIIDLQLAELKKRGVDAPPSKLRQLIALQRDVDQLRRQARGRPPAGPGKGAGGPSGGEGDGGLSAAAQALLDADAADTG